LGRSAVRATGLLPSNPLLKALAYIRERRDGLQVYLDDADVPMDTNHLERALRAVPMGRRAWLFCWTELGAKHIGMMQSLLTTCRLHEIDPYDYLVDVLQRIGEHPASRVEELTPRRWKALYAASPLRSQLHDVTRTIKNAA
jgi:transposase